MKKLKKSFFNISFQLYTPFSSYILGPVLQPLTPP